MGACSRRRRKKKNSFPKKFFTPIAAVVAGIEHCFILCLSKSFHRSFTRPLMWVSCECRSMKNPRSAAQGGGLPASRRNAEKKDSIRNVTSVTCIRHICISNIYMPTWMNIYRSTFSRAASNNSFCVARILFRFAAWDSHSAHDAVPQLAGYRFSNKLTIFSVA